MAITTNNLNLEVIKWRKNVLREYIRGNAYSPYMGEGPTNIINVVNDLRGDRGAGDQIWIPLSGALSSPGVSTGPLVGNEEKLDLYGFPMWVDWSRNAVLLMENQLRRSVVDQLELVRPLLTEWGKSNQRNEITLALDAIPSETKPTGIGTSSGQRVNGILWGNATDTNKNDFLAQNSDRVLFGGATNNFSTTYSTAIGNMLNAEDRPSAAQVSLLKRIARTANPIVAPYQTEDGREYYVLFCGSRSFRDYQADTTINSANLNARPREGSGMDRNPIFQGGDLLWNGVIIREIPEIDFLCLNKGNTAAPATPILPVFLCGQGAVGFAWGKTPRPTERAEDDYGMLIGRGIEMVYGIGKLARKLTTPLTGTSTLPLKQHGVVTGYVAAPAD